MFSKRETHDLVVGNTVGLGPAAHDKGVIYSDDNDLINALGLDLIDVFQVGRNVRARASRCEGTWDRDKNNLLVLEFCIERCQSA